MLKKFFARTRCVLTSFILLIIALLIKPIQLNETQIMYLSSTLAQVCAALFGLTITGYIFLEDKLTKTTEQDETLFDIIDKLKNEYRKNLVFIGVITGITILLCIINILVNNAENYYTYLTLKCSTIFALANIASIIIFVIKVTDPKKFVKASQKALIETGYGSKENVNDNKNYLPEFMLKYNELENFLCDYSQKHGMKYRVNEHPTSYNSIKYLRSIGILDSSTFGQLDELRKYRNYLVHGNELFVNEYMYNELLKLIDKVENIVTKV